MCSVRKYMHAAGILDCLDGLERVRVELGPSVLLLCLLRLQSKGPSTQADARVQRRGVGTAHSGGPAPAVSGKAGEETRGRSHCSGVLRQTTGQREGAPGRADLRAVDPRVCKLRLCRGAVHGYQCALVQEGMWLASLVPRLPLHLQPNFYYVHVHVAA